MFFYKDSTFGFGENVLELKLDFHLFIVVVESVSCIKLSMLAAYNLSQEK